MTETTSCFVLLSANVHTSLRMVFARPGHTRYPGQNLCSTAIGSFFQGFVKISYKTKANVGSELKICGHTSYKIIPNRAEYIYFLMGMYEIGVILGQFVYEKVG